MPIHTIGLQRSGTNFIGELLKRNLPVEVIPTGDRSICWKHALPGERTPAGINAGEAVARRSDVFVVLVVKHPLHWIDSVTRRNAQDLYLKRKKLLDSTGKPDLPAVVALYNAFHEAWLKVLERPRYSIVRYEQSLAMPIEVVRTVGAAIGSDIMTPGLELPDHVPYSRAMSDDRKELYRQGIHGLDENTVDMVTSLVDLPLLERLGYSSTPPVLNQTLRAS